MTDVLDTRSVGRDVVRVDAIEKVTGAAPYAAEYPADRPAYLHPLQATIARGRITGIDTRAAQQLDGVVAVLTHENATRLQSDEDKELWILQVPEVGFRGQFIAAVIADHPEIAREAADLVQVSYEVLDHDAELYADHPGLYKPDRINPSYPPDTSHGDVDEGLAEAVHVIDETYTTPMQHNNPMEPHATMARFENDELTLHDSTQGVHSVRAAIAPLFGLAEGQVHVTAPYVGGGFGSKGTAHAHVVLAALGALHVRGRTVKLALTRQQMFSVVGYRTPTIQRIRLGADGDGRLTALAHEVIEQTSRIKEFAEQTAVCSRMMYATPNRLTTHRLVALDVAVPTWMRAPGETPGMYAAEVAMDELACVAGLDPIELRILNDPATDPDTGLPFSSRNLVACLREGAREFDWGENRDPTPRTRLRDGWLIGTGVASSTYPAMRISGSRATVRHVAEGRYEVAIASADIGTGAKTVLGQIAADALEVDYEAIDMLIGDTAFPPASVAGGSSGTASWGSTIVAAARAFRERYGDDPDLGASVTETMPANPAEDDYAMHAYGAQFAEVHVRADTGEIRVERMLGVFAVGRILNPRTARSQLLGGMTMGISMALHEHSVVDSRFGHVVNHDLAGYHIASNADIRRLEVRWVDEDDPHVNPMGSKGIGEIGIVGTAAAIVNATHHATGIRIRDLPITADLLFR